MKYKTLKLPKSPDGHVMQIKENPQELEQKKESIKLPKHETIINTLDIYYVNLGKIRI